MGRNREGEGGKEERTEMKERKKQKEEINKVKGQIKREMENDSTVIQ